MYTIFRRSLGMGWLPDYPDFRDMTIEHDAVSTRMNGIGQTDSVKKMLSKAGASKPGKITLPSSVSLVPWFSPVEDQGQLVACTANA